LPCRRLGRALGLPRLLVKAESQLPTGSFKSRRMRRPSAWPALRPAPPGGADGGNAGGALAAYGAAPAGSLRLHARGTRRASTGSRPTWAGARVFLVNGLITDCGRLVREGTERMGWFDMSTLKEPYRLEGKKTMGLEWPSSSAGGCRT